MDFTLPFSGRAHEYTDEEKRIVLETMEQAVPLTQGKHLQAFEEKFRQYLGCNHAFAVCNATAALELTAQLALFEPGDEVICPTHTFTASLYPFIKKGATPVWADIDLDTRVVTARTIEACITPKTKAIIVVHLYGFCIDMKPIAALAEQHGVLLIEDVAQALGTEQDGQKAGSFGDFGIFSFHSHKNITTLGEGGMLVVKEKRYADIIPMLRHNGHCGFEFEREHYWKPAMGNVDLPELDGKPLMPNNYCLGEVECALGTVLLDRLDTINSDKRRRAMKVINALSDIEELVFHKEDSLRHNYHLLAARVTDGLRDRFMEMMAEDKGVQCVVQYYPLNRYDLYKKLGFGEAQCPNSDHFFDSMVSFPFHHAMREEEIDYLIAAIRDVIKALRP